MEWFAPALEKLGKITPPSLLGLGVASGLIAFMPDSMAATLGIDQLRTEYRGWIGAAFIVSWSYLIAHVVWWGKGHGAKWWQARRINAVRIKHLTELTPQEKGYLEPFIKSQANTIYLPIQDGVIGGLGAKEIVYRSSSLFEPHRVPYNLQPWARTHLTAHPELLDGAIPRKPQRDEW